MVVEQIPLGVTALGGMAILMWAVHMAVASKSAENHKNDCAHFSRGVQKYAKQVDSNAKYIKAQVRKAQRFADIGEDDVCSALYRQAFVYPPFTPSLTKAKINTTVGEIVVGRMKFGKSGTLERRKKVHEAAKKVGRALSLGDKEIQEISSKRAGTA